VQGAAVEEHSYRAASALASAVTADEVVAAIFDHIAQDLGVLSVGLWLIDEAAEVMRLVGQVGMASSVPERVAFLPLDANLPGPVSVRSGKPIVFGSAQARDEDWPLLKGIQSRAQASVTVPLVARGRALGCLGLGLADPDPPEERVAVLASVAQHCALALDRAALYDAERRSRTTLEFLAEAITPMLSALDPEEVLRRLVRFSVPTLAPWCAVYVAEGGVLRRAAIEIEGEPELGAQLLHADAVDIASDNALAVAYRTGTTQVGLDVGEAMMRTYTGSRLDAVARLGLRSAMFVPIPARGETIGVMSLKFGEHVPPSEDLRFAATGLAARAGIALANAQRYRTQLDAAQRLSAALLPERLPSFPTLELAARYVPATGEVCGDWYEAQALTDRELLIGVGDAAGHGLDAASAMAALRNSARALALVEPGPAGLVGALGELLDGSYTDSIATVLYGVIDSMTGQVRLSSAGHLPPLVARPDGEVEYLKIDGGPLLGCGWQAPYGETQLQLSPGSTLVLFTDGVVETRTDALDIGLQKLADIVSAASSATPAASGSTPSVEEIADRIVAGLCASAEDDCCLLVLRWLG
jgi:GAF domain-containing protein